MIKNKKKLLKICILILIAVFTLGCKNSSISPNPSPSISINVGTETEIETETETDVRAFIITKDNAGSIIQFNADNYKEHNDYIYANATAYISDYYCCAKDFCKIGNRFLSHKNRKYEIRNIEIDSRSEIVIYVYNSEGYSGYAYYDDDLKRIIIIPSIDNDCCVDAGLNVYKEASIVSDSIEPLYIIDVINSLKFKTKSLYFLIESDCFDENNIITKLIEYDWNEGD